MQNLPQEVKAVLAEFEGKREPFSELDVLVAMNKVCRVIEESGNVLGNEARYEAMAFNFAEQDNGKPSIWGTYFGPMMTWHNHDGSLVEAPGLRQVTPEALDYWAGRAADIENPILRGRYAALVWDLFPRVIGNTADVGVARLYVDAVIEMATRRAHPNECSMFRKLEHALSVAISINDTKRVENVRDAILQLEDDVAADDHPGLWGYAFDLLFDNKKVPLDDHVERKIIDDLEARLERVCAGSSTASPWAGHAAAHCLARHYRQMSQPEDVRRVLLKAGQAFSQKANETGPMVALAWIQQIEALYRSFGLTRDAAEVRKRIRELGVAAEKELVPYVTDVEIPNDELERHVRAMLEGGLDETIQRFVRAHIPHRSDTEKALNKFEEEYPLTFVMLRTIVDNKGRPVAHVGPLRSDLDGHVVMRTTQDLGISAIFMRCVIQAMFKRYDITTDVIMSWLDNSPLFRAETRELLRRGLKAYSEGDAIIALHLLVPQVEGAIRELAERAGADVYRPNRLGGMDLRPLDDLLRDGVVVENLTPDVAHYLRILFTDRRGINLRNQLCHGMLDVDSINVGLADRVFHAIVLLAQLREDK